MLCLNNPFIENNTIVLVYGVIDIIYIKPGEYTLNLSILPYLDNLVADTYILYPSLLREK